MPVYKKKITVLYCAAGLPVKYCKFLQHFYSVHYYEKSLVREGIPTFWNKNGASFPTFNHFWALSFEKITNIFFPPHALCHYLARENHQDFLPPTMPLSRSCQTTRVINPSAMRTSTLMKIFRLRGYTPTFWNNNRVSFPTFNYFWLTDFMPL